MTDLVIVGGGPSGLSAAHEAVGRGAKAVVLERLDLLGGLSRTTTFQSNRFDIGPHRFFTKNREIQALFMNMAAEDLLFVPRFTRILCDKTYFNYPLTPLNALFGVGPQAGLSILSSYISARARGTFDKRCDHFEDWVVAHFGRRLYEMFFKTYTEKVWGIPCTKIGPEWATQRIKGLTLTTAIRNALFKPRQESVKTLVDEFMYPRLGAGQLYDNMATRIRQAGGSIITGARVNRICRDGTHVRAVTAGDATGAKLEVQGRYFLVSAPLTEMIEMMHPSAPPEVLSACRALRYRNHVGVNLIVEGSPFPDNWIYVHSKDVRMARVANYANFSVSMCSRAGLSPLTVEYFCFPGDQIWNAADEALIELAKRELAQIGIVRPEQVLNGFVVRSDKAYPVIEIGYERHISTIRRWLSEFQNLLPIGRSGMFKYNNQDHAMATGLLAARTALGVQQFDPWLVNIDAEYHESAAAPQAPRNNIA